VTEPSTDRDGAANEPESSREDAADSSADYRVQLAEFEGPLDLLLYLIRKNEVSIYDIPIAKITEQYLEYLRLMEELDIGVAGEFLVMAATLIHIKTKLLLPRDPTAEVEGEDLEDPRQELIHQLLEHQKFKNAAEMLHTRAEVERGVFTRKDSEAEENAEVSASVFDLLGAFREVLLRLDAVVEIEIARDEVTLGQKLTEVRQLIETESSFSVTELFGRSRSRRELVITFLAVLELTRLRFIRIVQPEAFGAVMAERRERSEEEHDADTLDFSEDDYR
jgi:segregation and condensation protein A